MSIDLCISWGGQMLLGKRNNEPLKGSWFILGGKGDLTKRNVAVLPVEGREVGVGVGVGVGCLRS